MNARPMRIWSENKLATLFSYHTCPYSPFVTPFLCPRNKMTIIIVLHIFCDLTIKTNDLFIFFDTNYKCSLKPTNHLILQFCRFISIDSDLVSVKCKKEKEKKKRFEWHNHNRLKHRPFAATIQRLTIHIWNMKWSNKMEKKQNKEVINRFVICVWVFCVVPLKN